MDIICLNKTYLVSRTQLDDKNLELPGYNFVRSDHQSNKQEEVFLYYKTLLPLRVIDICLLQECICFEIMIGENCYIFVVLSDHQIRTRTFLIIFLIILN